MVKNRIRNRFKSKRRNASSPETRRQGDIAVDNGDNENVIEQDSSVQPGIALIREGEERSGEKRKKSALSFAFGRSRKQNIEATVKSRNAIVRRAYSLFAGRLPAFPEYRQVYEQAGMTGVYEAYISTGLLFSTLITIPTFVVSLLIEEKFFPRAPIVFPILGSIILGAVSFATCLVLCLSYPILRRRAFKSSLENQLAYSFGILGVLSAAGLSLERLFEKIASSESNPVLAELARRFLRNVRIFGIDSEKALVEVAEHSPSEAFSKMLASVSVAHKTTGSIHDLVMFESARLLQEKSDKLRKSIGSLAVLAELYVTLVVVGPIIFIVMMAIFGLLPAGGLPQPVSIINLIVFIGIPFLSIMFVLLLDSVVAKA